MFRNSVYFTVYAKLCQKKGSSVHMDEFSLTNLIAKLKIEGAIQMVSEENLCLTPVRMSLQASYYTNRI